MTPQMIERANINKEKLAFDNIDFKLGDIESLPVENASIDVVISNCVLNLVPDKEKAFNEIYRVLKPGAHFCVSDIVNNGQIPDGLKESAEAYAGCISGAISKKAYLEIIKNAGFINIEIKQSVKTDLPDDLLAEFMDHDEIARYRESELGIFSVTVVGYKN
jgi:arsenite methyltransferase